MRGLAAYNARMSEDLAQYIRQLGQAARKASRVVAAASTQTKSAALQGIARATDAAREDIKAANAQDMAAAEKKRPRPTPYRPAIPGR